MKRTKESVKSSNAQNVCDMICNMCEKKKDQCRKVNIEFIDSD